MLVDDFLRLIPDYAVTPAQVACAHFLEQRGKQFMVDFGFKNAEEMTWKYMNDLVH